MTSSPPYLRLLALAALCLVPGMALAQNSKSGSDDLSKMIDSIGNPDATTNSTSSTNSVSTPTAPAEPTPAPEPTIDPEITSDISTIKDCYSTSDFSKLVDLLSPSDLQDMGGRDQVISSLNHFTDNLKDGASKFNLVVDSSNTSTFAGTLKDYTIVPVHLLIDKQGHHEQFNFFFLFYRDHSDTHWSVIDGAVLAKFNPLGEQVGEQIRNRELADLPSDFNLPKVDIQKLN